MKNLGFTVSILASVTLSLTIASQGAEPAAIKTSPADLDAVKRVLAVTDAAPADAAALHHSLGEAISKIADPSLRQQVQDLIPELETAAAHHARVVQVVADLKASGGVTEVTPGGPAWLRTLAGDSAMAVFDQLTTVDINDKQSPHNKDYHLLNNVTDEWLARLDGMTELQHLNISNTAIHGPGLTHISNFIHLESLGMTLCPVTDEYLKNLSNLTEMKRFSLASATCDGTGFKYLGKMTKLENLNFHHALVNDDGLREICRMTSVQRLEIVHCHWTDSGAANLANLKNMQRLQLGSTMATGASVAFLRGLTNLKELDLHDLKDASLAVRYASEIPSLTVLRLYLGGLKDDDFKQIAKLSNLEELILSGGPISDSAAASLAELKKLKKLTPGGKLSPAALEKLKAALPGVEIVIP